MGREFIGGIFLQIFPKKCLFWSKVLVLLGLVGVFPKKWSYFLIIKWYFKQNSKRIKQLWCFSILAIAWLIWSERNRRIFEYKSRDPSDIWELSCLLVGQWAKASRIFDASDCFLFSLDCISVVGC